MIPHDAFSVCQGRAACARPISPPRGAGARCGLPLHHTHTGELRVPHRRLKRGAQLHVLTRVLLAMDEARSRITRAVLPPPRLRDNPTTPRREGD